MIKQKLTPNETSDRIHALSCALKAINDTTTPSLKGVVSHVETAREDIILELSRLSKLQD